VIAAARNKDLKKALKDHLQETRRQVQRLEKVFDRVGASPRGHKCMGMEGLIKESASMLKEDAEPDVLDAAIIAAAQRIEHYEMAGYGVARTYAEKLGDFAAADLLQETLEEEAQADRHLTRLAERTINIKAMV
jgi:ferritin-like metal-binding protein YciE